MENYEFICQIGKGNFGRISKIIRKSDQKTLIWKELDYGQMSEKEKEQIVSEVNILRELKHPNIVRYYDRIIDKKNSRIYIIMEYCEGGDLNQLIKRCKKTGEFIAEDIIWKIFTQVLLAIHVIHNHKEGKILHRDIKPSNIFLDKDNNVKLGDFGLSRELSDQSKFAYSHVGTPYYMSPEQIDETKYNEKSDIWSLGCFLYELTTFHPPFEAKNQIMLAMRIKSGKVEKINKRYSEELWRVITWMLTVNYNNRPSSEDLLNIPEVCIRLREKRIKDTLYKLKLLEEKLNIRDREQKEKEEKLVEKEKILINKENNLKEKENELKKKEKEIKEKENELKEKEKKYKSFSTLSNATTMGYSSKFLSSKNSNDLNNMNNSNNNSNSNNNFMNNNIDVYSIKNNIIKNMINNNSDLNSLLMYSSKTNSSNNNNNSNNLLITANTNTSITNISLLHNNNNNNSIVAGNSMNTNYLLKSSINEDTKNESQNNTKRLNDDYSSHNYDTNSKNNYIHYSTNNVYSDYFNNRFKTSSKSIIDNNKYNDIEINKDYMNNNNLNSSNISNSNSIKKNNIGGSLINTLKKKISSSFISDENNYINILNNGKQKYDNKTRDEKANNKNNQSNSFGKNVSEYENNDMIKNSKNNEQNLGNISLNRTMKYNSKNNEISHEKEQENDTNKYNNNINNVKNEKNLVLFREDDKYTNLISQINDINTKYDIPSNISVLNKNNFYKNNLCDNQNNDNINNNITNNINNYNPNLLNKSNKSISSNKININNNLSNKNLSNTSNVDKNNRRIKTVKNISKEVGGVNNIYKYNTNNNSIYDFEIANKIGYETGRPSSHCGIIDSFPINENSKNTNINNNKIVELIL